MGSYIFLIAVVFEIAFVVFCNKTKSNQNKARSIIRIAAFLIFLLLTLISVLQWDFTYYALSAFLLLLTIISVINLIRKKQEKKSYKKSRIIGKAVVMTLLMFIATLPSIIFPQYAEIKPTGQYKVSTVNHTYIDTSRIETYTNTGEKRKLNVEFWYPKNTSGKYPLIIFSHGALGVKSSNETLYNELASHGYVVCSIDHTYQCIYTTDDKGNTTYVDKGYEKELNEENAQKNPQLSYELYQKWMKIRTGDINFVINYILAKSRINASNAEYKLVDPTKIGVMGHSLGGSAALGIGKMRNILHPF